MTTLKSRFQWLRNNLKGAILVVLLALVAAFFVHQAVNHHFRPMTNFDGRRTVSLDMDLENAVTDGIYIPSAKQTKEGEGVFTFRFLALKKGLYYKIYYQNESYKFADTSALSAENFYGSWEDVNVGFKPVEQHMVRDSLRIVGNPRNEQLYAGRWQRNPRVGQYGFMLVLCNEKGLNEIPDYVQHIGNTNDEGSFENPYHWFATHKSKNIKVVKSCRRLKTRAVLNAAHGVYVDESRNPPVLPEENCEECGYNQNLYQHALFEQFFSHVSTQYPLRNIPVIKDVVGDDPYTREEYEANKTRFDSSQLQMNYPVVSEHPCTTVKVGPDGEYITIINPASTEGNLRKESTGIRSRVGFTYGKFTGKIKFPEMLNDENIWNGLTYAFWLIYTENSPWNNRRPNFKDGGYIPKWDDSENPQRTPYHPYSEIDIEIVKASRHWPLNYYQWIRGDLENCQEDATLNNDVMFCCTNWDLASTEPPMFKAGIDSIRYNKKTKFETQRWYETYKALTTRTPMSNDNFKEQWYYYEIEWRPSEIIWRLGPDLDHMTVMGYMDDLHSSIPNNQMKCIVTQEYHYSEWWPPIVWDQRLIPYNKTDIEGRVYEIIIE